MNIRKLVPYAIQNETDIDKLRKFTTSQFERHIEAINIVHEYMEEINNLEGQIERLRIFSLSQVCKLNEKIKELEEQLSFYENSYKNKQH
jgi:hypothetical protein